MSNFRPINSILIIVSLTGALLLFSGCATKKPEPAFYPEPPAPPRIQQLKQFSNSSNILDNEYLKLLTGDDGSGAFSKAFGLAFFNGRLFVADSGKADPGIVVIDFEKNSLDRFNVGINKPINLAFDKDGTLYVCDLGEQSPPAIAVFTPQQKFLRRIELNIPDFRPASVLVVDDKLFVADIKNNVIHILDKKSGTLLKSFGKEDRLGWPAYLSMTPEGNILVTETGAQSLRLFNQEGQQLARIGEPGDRAGTFARPKATAIDKDGNIYAVDVIFQNVQILNGKGQPLMFFGQHPGNKDNLAMPAGIAITYDRMDIFQKYAAPGFKLEYVVAVSSQGAPNFNSKITLYGFGRMEGMDYNSYGE